MQFPVMNGNMPQSFRPKLTPLSREWSGSGASAGEGPGVRWIAVRRRAWGEVDRKEGKCIGFISLV
ncbi:MAG: hypothetical protein D4R64_11070 [Porphyromonadaceae bacterium]|nr:MAG: hypothetical protein D4R64_11070 [Porphyromonadaceae bacterium]